MVAPKPAPIPPASEDLGEFDGVPVTQVAVAYRNGGDGWSEALRIFPRVHETGDEVYWVIKTVTGPIDHDALTGLGKKCRSSDVVDGAFESYRRVEDQIFVQVIEVNGDAVMGWLTQAQESVNKVRAEREEAERIAALQKAEEDALAAEAEAGIMRLVPPVEKS